MHLQLELSPPLMGMMVGRSLDLRLFLVLLIAGSVVLLIGRGLMVLGVGGLGLTVAAIGGSLVGVLLWCLAFHAAPRLTRQATAAAVCAALVLCLLSLWIEDSREEARRQQVTNNLRQVGMGAQERINYSSPAAQPQSPSWVREVPQFEMPLVTGRSDVDPSPVP